ncbi:MAG: radical SAM protein [Candidatus Ranarchaeia archaeon]
MQENKIDKTPFGGLIVGKLPLGCEMCLEGKKLVVFATGLCKSNCFFCPVSTQRIYHDVIFANERPIKDLNEILEEKTVSNAAGASITGGEPLLVFQRVIDSINLLKDHYGENFHIHMYTTGKGMDVNQLKELENAGLDELRFHPFSSKNFPIIEKAKKFSYKVGAEIPLVPGRFNFIKKLATFLNQIDADLFNLNELEFSDSNQEEMEFRGFELSKNSLSAAIGSHKLGLSVIDWVKENTDLNAYFCPTNVKDVVQLTNRFRNRAENIAEPYSQITEEGLIVKGIIYAKSDDLIEIRKMLVEEYSIPQSQIQINEEKNWIETHPEFVKDLRKSGWDGELAIIEEHPTYFRTIITKISI